MAVPEASASARHRSEAKSCFAAAKQALLRGQIELKLDLLNQTEALAGPLPQILLTRVNALRQARLWPEALRRSRELLNTHPNSSDTHLALGFIHLLQDHWLDGWREREWRWQHPGFRNMIPPLSRSGTVYINRVQREQQIAVRSHRLGMEVQGCFKVLYRL